MRLVVLIAGLILLATKSQAEVLLRDQFGSFTSPGYPNPYADNLNEIWKISVRPGRRIKIRFTSFDLEDSYEEGQGPCVYDYVLITEGDSVIGRFCGNSRHYPMDAPRSSDQWFYSKRNTTTVQFVSDYSNEGISPHGFKAHYAEEDVDECLEMRRKEMYTIEDWDELLTCDHFCNNVPGSYYCSCRSRYTLHSDQYTCIATFCENQVLNDDQGVIESPAYPEKYAKYADCSWHIQVRDGLSVQLTFVGSFEVEEHVDEGCAYDILKITYNGNEDAYCGKTAPDSGQVMDMNTRDVKVTFTSDRSVETAGFKIIYNTTRIKCLTELTDPDHGSKSSNPKGYYEFEDVVTFECDIGYEFAPGVKSRLECLSDGQWDHPQPLCQIKVCGSPRNLISVDYSSIVDLQTKRFEYNEIVEVQCDSWYEKVSGYSIWRCSDSKQWVPHAGRLSDGLPECRPKCGSRLNKIEPIESQTHRGKRVKEYSGWPWMAFVNRVKGREENQYCGGTLVNEMTIVTAAHCIDDLDIDDEVYVWLGVLDRTSDNRNFTQEFIVTGERRFVHADYGQSTVLVESFNADIAVLKLDRPVKLSEEVHPICLPASEAEQNRILARHMRQRENVIVTGWGKTETGKYSKHLMKVRFPLVGIQQCRNRYFDTFGEEGKLMITDNMICAGTEQGRNDACQGDSGGPLMTKNTRGDKWYLSGIVSFADTTTCGRAETYGVYTDVGKYLDFLEFHMSGSN